MSDRRSINLREPTSGFSEYLNARYGCSAVVDGRWCQLYGHRDGAHAHAALSPSLRTRRRRYVPGMWHRWDETSAWLQEPGSERLAWCCMCRR